MTETCLGALEETTHRATGYTSMSPGGPLPRRVSNEETLAGRPSPAGGAFSTAADLLRFVRSKQPGDVRIAGGGPGVNAVVQRRGAWTVIVLANYDPPSAEELGTQAMRILDGMEKISGERK